MTLMTHLTTRGGSAYLCRACKSAGNQYDRVAGCALSSLHSERINATGTSASGCIFQQNPVLFRGVFTPVFHAFLTLFPHIMSQKRGWGNILEWLTGAILRSLNEENSSSRSSVTRGGKPLPEAPSAINSATNQIYCQKYMFFMVILH